MQNTPKIIVLSFLAIFIAGGFMLATPTAQAAGTITLTQTSNVVVTFVSSSADFNNLFGISSPVARSFGYGHNTSSGATFNVDNVASGSELVFYITNGDGQTFYSGSASRNQDNTDHANVTSLGNNQWQIGFEDQLNGGDRDYNDIIIRVSATTACTANASKLCVGNNVYWYDSCNVQGSLFQTCNANQTCQNAQCVNSCTQNYSQKCVGNSVYNFDSCNVQGSLIQTCNANQYCSNAQCINNAVIVPPTNQYCANGTTMTPAELNSAIYDHKVLMTWNMSGTTATAHIVNNVNCTFPATMMSYKQFSWNSNRLDSSVFVASSGSVNITANGVTDISVPVTGSCLNIVALWYNQGIQQMHDADLIPIYGTPSTNSYTFFNTQTANGQIAATAPLCTNATPVQNIRCSSNYDCGASSVTGSLFCQGNNVYQNYNTYTCNNAGTASSYCSSNTSAQLQTTCGGNQTCSNGSCIGQYNNTNYCTYHAYQRCSINSLYWFDSCGNQQDISQVCPNGCSGNICNSNYYNYNNNYNYNTGYSSVQTNPATNLFTNQATLNGYWNGNNNNYNYNNYNNGQTATVWFQWGTSNYYGFETSHLQQSNSGAFTQNISNLTPGNVYHFRAAAQDSTGNIVYGQDSTFTVAPQVLGASYVSTGLTNNFWADSFFLPLMLALLGLWMYKSGMFISIEKWISGKKRNSRAFKAEKELTQRILEIRKFEN